MCCNLAFLKRLQHEHNWHSKYAVQIVSKELLQDMASVKCLTIFLYKQFHKELPNLAKGLKETSTALQSDKNCISKKGEEICKNINQRCNIFSKNQREKNGKYLQIARE